MTHSIDAARRAAQARAAVEVARARDAAARATRSEQLASSGPESMRALHARMAKLYRRTERRHLATAEVHRLFGLRATQNGQPGRDGATAFLAALAGLLDTTSVMVSLRTDRAIVAVAASDDIARKAHELEIVMAEGPVSEAARSGTPVLVAGNALCERWPRYGPAVAGLGVTTVMAAPLGLADARFGAMCALGRSAISDGVPVTLDGVARALTGILLKGTVGEDSRDYSTLSQIGPIIAQDVVNQAVGMVSVQCGCSIDAAADLLVARAFAEELPVADVATQVVSGRLLLADL